MAAVSLILPFLNFSSNSWRGVALHFRNRFNLIGREHSAIRERGGKISPDRSEIPQEKLTHKRRTNTERRERGESRGICQSRLKLKQSLTTYYFLIIRQETRIQIRNWLADPKTDLKSNLSDNYPIFYLLKIQIF